MKITRFFLLTLVFSVLFGGVAAGQTSPSTRPSPGERLFTQGGDAMYKGDFAGAVRLLEQAVAADESKTSYKLALARAYQYGNQPEKARALLKNILKANPDHVEAGQLLADAYTADEQWKSVVEVLQPLLKFRHDYPMYHRLAQASYALGSIDAAREYYEQAIKLNPRSAIDHYHLGNIQLSGNLFALAAESYRTALALGIDTPVLHYKMATAYFNLRNYFGDVTVAAVKGGRPDSIAGDMYLIEPVPGSKDQFHAAAAQTAIYQLARAVADGLEPRADIRFLKANIYLNAGRYEPAFAMFKQLEPEMPEADKPLFYYYYAQAAFGVGRFEEYLALLDRAIELNPQAYQASRVEAYLKVADQYNQAGDLAKYIHYLRAAVAESPRNASLHLQLGDAFEQAARHGDAVIQWRMTLDLEPDHPRRLELLNRIATPPTTAPSSSAPAR